jgi:hypothetical protein
MVNFEYLFRISAENSELSGVWGKELFESDEKKKKDERSERVFLPPMLLILMKIAIKREGRGNKNIAK